MKIRFAVVCAMTLLGAAVGLAQSAKEPQVRINLDDPPPSAKKKAPVNPNAPAKPADASVAKVDPNKPAAKADPKAVAKKDEKKKEDEIGKIQGMEIAHGEGFLGLAIVDGTFRLSFYNAKKKPVAPDVARAVFRWSVPYQKQPERVFLTAGEKALVSDKIVRPPYSFKLFVTLFKGESDDDAENLTVDFSQES